MAYAINPSSLLNIGFTAKVFLGFQTPCTCRLASKPQRVRHKKISFLQQNLSGLHERERDRQTETETETESVCVCVWVWVLRV